MDLRQIVTLLYSDSRKTPPRGLGAIAEAENYLQQAYQGRYLFELIQNARDANKLHGRDGDIIIQLNNRTLSISNTGVGFSEKGIEGITTIGRSTKHSQEFIGFKGIGFKSVQEITDTPNIVTESGTIAFDRKLTADHYEELKEVIEFEELPLFFFPHFIDNSLSKEELAKGIVTRIDLPLKESISEAEITNSLKGIHIRNLILLGSINRFIFSSLNWNISYEIKRSPQLNLLEVYCNNEVARFKQYSPKEKLTVPFEIIDLLDVKEKRIFQNSPNVDISILIELDKWRITTSKDAKLYLFYPLEILSGFRFIIHSYFIVNPERKELRQSPLNSFLLESIGIFIGTEMLESLKKDHLNTCEILTFQRTKGAKLENLYNSLVACLKTKKFILDPISKTYFGIDDVIIADHFDKGLFLDGKLGSKRVIYMDDGETINWLMAEFDVTYLTYDKIAEEIEKECERQLISRNVKFFQNLYNYVSSHEQLNLKRKKVLLTDRWKLVADEDDVTYRGKEKFPLFLTDKIKDHIYFINREIKITDLRDGKSRTGIREFNTFELVKRLLKLFKVPEVPKGDVLNAIFNLELDVKSELEVQEKILLPVRDSKEWLSPITTVIYWPSEELLTAYPTANFIDSEILKFESRTADKRAFLKLCGVWDMPGIFLKTERVELSAGDTRVPKLRKATNTSARTFFIVNDRVLDPPIEYTGWFTQVIIENWTKYRDYLASDKLPKLEFSSPLNPYQRSVSKGLSLELTSFAEQLRTSKWIITDDQPKGLSPLDIVGIDPMDIVQSHNQVIKKHLKLFPINYWSFSEFIEILELIHLDGNTMSNYLRLFDYIYQNHKDGDITPKEFTDFYNKMLGKLFDFFQTRKPISVPITPLNEIHFLSYDELLRKNSWSKAKDIFYLDDKPAYDILPSEIKQHLQPMFTNKDRNTFGRIASQIGKVISKSFTKSLVPSEPLREYGIKTYYPSLAEYVAILERSADIAVSKKTLDNLRKVKVFERDRIEVLVKIENKELPISTTHFIDDNNNIYFINSTFSDKSKIDSQILSELFVKILDNDIKKYRMDLLLYMDTSDKNSFLNTYEINEARIIEIADQLNFIELTSAQRFWDAVLSAKGISNRANYFTSDSIEVEKIVNATGLPFNDIVSFQETFNFQRQSDRENIDPLNKLLDRLSLLISKVNESLFPKIDFRTYHNNQLLLIRNKFQKVFEAKVYSTLNNRDTLSQSRFLQTLDLYSFSFEPEVTPDVIQINREQHFIKLLNQQFDGFYFIVDDIDKGVDAIKLAETYARNLTTLKQRLSSIAPTSKTDFFLQDGSRRSLLYFGNVDFLVENFKEWVSQQTKEVSKKTGIDAVTTEITGQNTAEVEQVTPKSVDMTPPNGKKSIPRTPGKRIDGSSGEQQKKDTGFGAELVVYETLAKKYSEVRWVSKYASLVPSNHPGYNPEGDDRLGYDIEYLDDIGNKHFIEVKGRKDGAESFEITRNEVETAQSMKDNYRVFFVSFALDNSKRKIRDLGNPFAFNDGEDFFKNKKFTAIYSSFEIKFNFR